MWLTLSAAWAATTTLGALTLDGVPDVPARVYERGRPYTEIRSATLFDFDPADQGVLIGTRFGDTVQVHRVLSPGGDRQQLTFFADTVGGAFWDPRRTDGFYFAMDKGGNEFYQLYWFDLATGTAKLASDGHARNEGFSMSHAGGRFAYASTRRDGTDFDLYVQDGADPATAKLVYTASGQWDVLAWSPDDTRLVVEHEVSATKSSLHLLDLGTGTLTDLDTGHAGDVAYGGAVFTAKGDALFYVSDEGGEFKHLVRYDLATGKPTDLTPTLPWDVTQLTISRDGQRLAWVVNEGGRSTLWLGRASEPQKAKKVVLPLGVVGAIGFDRPSTRLGVTLSSTDSPGDVWMVDLSGQAVRWTHSEVGGLDVSRFVEPRLVTFPSFDGKTIPAWEYVPHTEGRHPVIIGIHGGPEGQSAAGFSATAQYWVDALGAAVIQPNVRGSSGYGRTWLGLDDGLRRLDSVHDIGALLDWISTQPDLDPTRVAVTGGSYGGYMVLATMVEYADRLRCGVDMVGPSNFVTFLEKTESYRRDLRRVEYGDERVPEVRAFLEQIAPVHHVDAIKHPLLVGQGKNDPRVPQNEAEQIVKAVRDQGGSAWYVLAADEGHGFRKQANRDQWSAISAWFFESYLLPPVTPGP